MEFVKEHDHYDWRTKDDACLYIRHTSKAAAPPQEFTCIVIGHSGILRPATMQVPTQNLTFIGAGLFGPARDKTDHSAGWTGDAYRFGIYGYRPGYGRENVVILRTDGGGFYAYIDVSLTAAEMWHYLCATCRPEMLWNICAFAVHTYDLAEQHGRQVIMTAFAEGRVKKKKSRNGFQVYVESQRVAPSDLATFPSSTL